ncbi:N-acetylmuramoyl-L-alanine amidase [Pseudoalteromonas sp. A601]|uniref:peptidoglycan recognition protein family protein n=1 Tax=Pseudoalteromonas sp. A601 TaxID=1967839 RepID=UPI000B3D06A8|nr:peptidoglycan recognition family protein [Pseudoalteromonas sp. A601]OUS70327.1 N-acetylmuramoyl-L-alanine amidase [Pseudoalteromonas sp. A601]
MLKIKFLLFLLLFNSVAFSTEEINIIKKPINFNETRQALTLEYLEKHYGIQQSKPTISPSMVVVHWTVIPTMEQTFDAFDPVTLPSRRKKIKSGGDVNVSSQFLVDRDGTIYQLMPDNWMARHTIGLNYYAIGIENVANGTTLPLTEKQIQANISLIKHLYGKYPIEYVLGHSEYSLFKATKYWLEKDPDYFTHKTDPDSKSMDTIRAGLRSLDLKDIKRVH